jgi:hypothetical protein
MQCTVGAPDTGRSRPHAFQQRCRRLLTTDPETQLYRSEHVGELQPQCAYLNRINPHCLQTEYQGVKRPRNHGCVLCGSNSSLLIFRRKRWLSKHALLSTLWENLPCRRRIHTCSADACLPPEVRRCLRSLISVKSNTNLRTSSFEPASPACGISA